MKNSNFYGSWNFFCIRFLLALFNIIYTCIYEKLNFARNLKIFPKTFVFHWTFL